MFGRFSSQFREHLGPLVQVGWGAAKFFAVMHLTFDYVFDITLVRRCLLRSFALLLSAGLKRPLVWL